jgi:hypothetical protein
MENEEKEFIWAVANTILVVIAFGFFMFMLITKI